MRDCMYAWLVGAYAFDVADADVQTYLVILSEMGLEPCLVAVPENIGYSVIVTRAGVVGKAEWN